MRRYLRKRRQWSCSVREVEPTLTRWRGWRGRTHPRTDRTGPGLRSTATCGSWPGSGSTTSTPPWSWCRTEISACLRILWQSNLRGFEWKYIHRRNSQESILGSWNPNQNLAAEVKRNDNLQNGNIFSQFSYFYFSSIFQIIGFVWSHCNNCYAQINPTEISSD